MASDQELQQAAKRLEDNIRNPEEVQNILAADSYAYSQEDFSKIVDFWRQLNEADRNSDVQGILGPPPDIEVHRDGLFGAMGNVDQVVLNDGKKHEVYETGKHRQSEVQDVMANLTKGVRKMQADYTTDPEPVDKNSVPPMEITGINE